MSYCAKCNKSIGGIGDGDWETYKGKKYCEDCLQKVKGKVEYSKSCKEFNCIFCQKVFILEDSEFEEVNKNGKMIVKCPYCNKNNLVKLTKQAAKDSQSQPKRDHASEKYCHKCGALKKGKYCHECGTGVEDKIMKNQITTIPTQTNPRFSTDKPTSKKAVEEIMCTCNQCGHVWHYLKKDEQILAGQAVGNLMVGAGMCCNPFGSLFVNKSIEASREAEKFSKCPKCGTRNIKKESYYYEK